MVISLSVCAICMQLEESPEALTYKVSLVLFNTFHPF